MLILGINSFHADSSSCLLLNGKLLSAVEEERFNRIKHFSGFPIESIKYCLSSNNFKISDIDYIAINQNSYSNLSHKLLYLFFNKSKIDNILNKIFIRNKRNSIIKCFFENFKNDIFRGKIINVNHHLAHISSAYYPSPFSEAVNLSIDGFGDFTSTAWGVGIDNKIRIDGQILFPHSMGIFYQAMTQYLGFNNYGDEYKVMGLAPYGKPVLFEKIQKLINISPNGMFNLDLSYFCHYKENLNFRGDNGIPVINRLYTDKLEDLLGPSRKMDEKLCQRHMDIAHCTQLAYENVLFTLLNSLYKRYNIKQLTVSGGCAMNSVANGKIKLKTPFSQIYIQSAAGDAGGAIGAALYTWHKFQYGNSNITKQVHDHAYWGPSFSDNEIYEIIKKCEIKIAAAHCFYYKYDSLDLLLKETASCISMGMVVGWFQGRMEWGPRALGNRSILCDPRRADMKDILNIKIKRRESFRPFAPSVLQEKMSEWFEQSGDVPFMSEVFQIKKDKRKFIPAVTHVDGSGRLQTVYKHTNHRYYELISSFEEITGIPILLNTSFNENEPIVCNPKEAIDCFLRTEMDILVIGNYILKRET
jgi:carbamoyltransferase